MIPVSLQVGNSRIREKMGNSAWDISNGRRGLIRSAFWGAVAIAVPVGARGMQSRRELLVDKRGQKGAFPTIAAALDRARLIGAPARIRVRPGRYVEKLTVDVPGLVIEGEGTESLIEFGAAAGHIAPDGRPWGTGRTATLTVAAPDVTLRNLTIRNSFDYLDDRRTGASGGAQAVALKGEDSADRLTVQHCRIIGYQDTLYVRSPRAAFFDCLVSGTVDFIFGHALACFDRCEIVSRWIPGAEVQGYVAGPSTHEDQPLGLVFRRCRLRREPGVPDASVWLGRSWRAGGNMSLTGAAAFIQCWMDAHIRPEGWTSMGYRGPDGEQRWLTPQEARLFEWASEGPGAAGFGPTRRGMPQEALRMALSDDLFGNWHP